MIVNVFDYQDYREFLRRALPTHGSTRGRRTQLAEVLGCQGGFISSVFNSQAHFSAEHAIKVARFLSMAEDEADYFLLLVHHNRAGSKDLEKYYSEKIKAVCAQRQLVRSRLPESHALSEAAQQTYYSSWHYTAVHMCLMIGSLQNRHAIAQELKLTLSQVDRVLKFLLEHGLAVNSGDRIETSNMRFHLSADSPLVAKHHTNWRMRAIDSLDSDHSSNLHYSIVMSLSEEAAQKIRSLCLELVQKSEPVLRQAENKTLYAMNIDLFNVLY